MNKPLDADEIAGLQKALVEKLVNMGYIRSLGIERAFKVVPRHLFAPGVALERVYSDNSIPTKRADGKLVSSSSQPAIMAIMLEQLQLQPGQCVLEIGAGTGYNAGLMTHLVGDSGQVVTIDIDEDIVESAREHLGSADLNDVKVVCGDGGLGYADGAPYDRIILTVGTWDIVPAWWQQLKPGGRLVLPLEINEGIQKSVAFDKKDDYLESVSVTGCGFITLRGAFAKPQDYISLGPEPGLRMDVNYGVEVNGDGVYNLFSGPSEVRPSGVFASPLEVFEGLALWLSLRVRGFCSLLAEGQIADRGLISYFEMSPGGSKMCSTYGLLGDDELCVFERPPDLNSPAEQPDGPQPSELFVRSYGSGTEVAERLIEETRAWDAAARPSHKGLSIRAYPEGADYIPSADEYTIDKQWTRLVLEWK